MPGLPTHLLQELDNGTVYRYVVETEKSEAWRFLFFFRKDEPYEEALGALVNLLRYPPVIRHILCYLCQPFMVSYKAFSRMVK